MLFQCGFPTGDLRRQTPALAIDHPQSHRLAGAQIGKAGSAQDFNMDENIFGAPETIGKAKTLAFVEPFDPRGFQRQSGDGRHVAAAQILDR